MNHSFRAPACTRTTRTGRGRRILVAGVAGVALALGSLAAAPAAYAAPVATSMTTVSYTAVGENSANVLSLQYLLTAAGHPVDTVGNFGPMTLAAVTAFQAERGLVADGVADESTWAQLIRPLTTGDTGDAVYALQVQLVKNGASFVPNGIFGPATTAATLEFQAASGLTADGVVGPMTWKALVSSGPGVNPRSSSATETFSTLSEEQLQNVRVIIAEGRNVGSPEYGLVIAIATAMQESRLRNLGGGDRDSVGLFQQRPSMGWGDASVLIDPAIATRGFFGAANSPTQNPGLFDIPGWESMTVTQAAQAVQRSGHPDAYAQWEPLAREALASEG